MNFIEFWNHPEGIDQRVGHLGMRIFHRRLRQIGLQTTGLCLSPPTMFFVAGFVLSPQTITNLNPTSIALDDRDTTSPVVLWRIDGLTVLLLWERCLLINLDASVLFVEAFVTDPYRNALALLGRDSQLSEVVKIATGDLVGTITSRSDRDLL